MWEGMNGYTPSTEELMQFMVMSSINSATQSKDWQLQNAAGEIPGNGCGEVPPDREGYEGFYGNSRNKDHGWTSGGQSTSTDIMKLGGDKLAAQAAMDDAEVKQSRLIDPEGRSGGKMQKVGDRWIFVRSDGSV